MTQQNSVAPEVLLLRDQLAETKAALDALRSGAADAYVCASGGVSSLPGSDEPYVSFFEVMNEGGVTIDADGTILHANARFVAMSAQPIERLRGLPFTSLIEPAERAKVGNFLATTLSATCDSLLLTGAAPLPVAISLKTVKTERLRYQCLVLTDLTERIKAEAELRIAAIAFESQDGMTVTDTEGVIVRVNRAFTRLTGFTAADVVGQTHALLRSGRHQDDFYDQMWHTLQSDRFWQGEIWNRTKSGKIYAFWLTISAVCDPGGTVTHYVGCYSEITKNKEAEAEVHRLAYYDPLTNLLNRRLLQDRMTQALVASGRSGKYGALLYLDLDHFKTLNDTRGHAVGDQLLVEIANRLRATVRQSDTVARLGGDEFVVMVEDISSDADRAAIRVGRLAEKIRQAVARPCALDGGEFHCAASIGIAMFHNTEDSADSLLRHADLAMYQAKSAGRNELRFFDPAMQIALNERSALESDLRLALDQHQLLLHYQAQVDSQGRIIGAEALVRWQHPLRGLVPPNDFIPLAEETGLVLPIGEWILRTACAQIRAWSMSAATRNLRLAVNVSARQFRQPDFVAQVSRALRDNCADPCCLKIELTESLVIANLAEAIANMQALKAMGIGFSMDDFGTGFSSLAYLKRLPLDQLKIDQSFIRDLVEDANDAAIVQTIITMGKTLGLEIIAEGVETESQRECLKAFGCLAYQGYLFAHPMPPDAFDLLLLQHAVSQAGVSSP